MKWNRWLKMPSSGPATWSYWQSVQCILTIRSGLPTIRLLWGAERAADLKLNAAYSSSCRHSAPRWRGWRPAPYGQHVTWLLVTREHMMRVCSNLRESIKRWRFQRIPPRRGRASTTARTLHRSTGKCQRRHGFAPFQTSSYLMTMDQFENVLQWNTLY